MKNIADLNRLYTEAKSVDSDIFAEQRSNVLLVNGDHYSKRNSKFWGRIRDNKQLSEEQKIRLTKNHIQKITKLYVNNITSLAPGVAILPANEKELADQKTAELSDSVWQDLKHKQKIKKKIREWVKDFIEIGEVFVKCFWDPNAGKVIGYEALIERDKEGTPVRDEMGNVKVIYDEFGQMKKSDRAIFSGELKLERYYGFNVFRDPQAKSMDEATFIGLEKMVSVSDLKKMVGSDEDKIKFLEESSKDTFTVFEGATGKYVDTKGKCLVREFYFRPSPTYPEGYFYVTTEAGVLFEGPLPFSIFPIIYCGFDEVATSARARSIIKVLRPYQAEVNRASSSIAETQITLGADKLLIQAGTKITHGGSLPGIRGVQYSGMPPGILAGRSGEQYLNYAVQTISEMYAVANLTEDAEQITGQMDPYALLYRSIRDKKKFSLYGEKFEEFLIEVCETCLELAKGYYDDASLIPAVGKREYINIAEFKNIDKLSYKVKCEARADNIDEMLGKQMAMTQVIQYVGKDLGSDAIGKIIKAMPFVNQDEAFNDLTLDYERSVNIILALDRGETPKPNKYDNHKYVIKRLTHRMSMDDFQFLPPVTQMNYNQILASYEQIEAQIQQDLLFQQSQYIPSGGYLVACDFYVNSPDDQSKTKRARLPYQAIDWLIKRLEAQGMSQEALENMNAVAMQDISRMTGQAPQPQTMPVQPPAPAPADPGVRGEPHMLPPLNGNMF